MLQRVSMVTTQVRDFDRMVSFYRDVLDLEVGWFEPNEFATLNLAQGGAAVAIAVDHPDRISDKPGSGWTPNLVVSDLDETIARLRSLGVEFEGPEEGADEGYRLVRIRDPEGNALGLTT